MPEKLRARNLLVNESKTEKFTIKRNGDNSWRKCKFVGSLLGTEEDIQRRKQLANNALKTLHSVFNNKRISTCVKIRAFKALIESIFLYNSECWGLTKKQENDIDCYQRRLLRNILKIKWSTGNWVSNTTLYELTETKPWSEIIKIRRLRYFGHVARLDSTQVPVAKALNEALRPTKKPKGGSKTTYLSTIKKQLTEKGTTIEQARYIAKDRTHWRKFCFCDKLRNQ